jgi:hypothetical protein
MHHMATPQKQNLPAIDGMAAQLTANQDSEVSAALPVRPVM